MKGCVVSDFKTPTHPFKTPAHASKSSSGIKHANSREESRAEGRGSSGGREEEEEEEEEGEEEEVFALQRRLQAEWSAALTSAGFAGRS